MVCSVLLGGWGGGYGACISAHAAGVSSVRVTSRFAAACPNAAVDPARLSPLALLPPLKNPLVESRRLKETRPSLRRR